MDPPLDEIWSLGLRNPWRFSFDRSTGDLVIGDVGQAAWEEVDYEPAPDGGRADNFGWNTCEGYKNSGTSTDCTLAGHTPPVSVYENPSAGCAAITGGYVVRDQSVTDLYGRYVFADLCSGQVSSIRLGLPAATDPRVEPIGAPQPVSFGEDSCGRIYLVSLAGSVSRLVGDNPADCSSPGPVDPGPVDPGPTEPAPADPGPTEAAPTTPSPTDPGAGDSGPAPTVTKRCRGKVVTHTAPAGGGPVQGTSGKDVIAGSVRDDLILGYGGDDVCRGGPGRDEIRSC